MVAKCCLFIVPPFPYCKQFYSRVLISSIQVKKDLHNVDISIYTCASQLVFFFLQIWWLKDEVEIGWTLPETNFSDIWVVKRFFEVNWH